MHKPASNASRRVNTQNLSGACLHKTPSCFACRHRTWVETIYKTSVLSLLISDRVVWCADLCATSTTTSSLCTATTDGGASCPTLPVNATCSGFVGMDLECWSWSAATACYDQRFLHCKSVAAGHCDEDTVQLCNAQVASLALYDSYTLPTAGVCVTPVHAGEACTVGYGMNMLVTSPHSRAWWCPTSSLLQATPWCDSCICVTHFILCIHVRPCISRSIQESMST